MKCGGCDGRGWIATGPTPCGGARGCRKCGGAGRLTPKVVARLIGERDARVVERLDRLRVRSATAARMVGPLVELEARAP